MFVTKADLLDDLNEIIDEDDEISVTDRTYLGRRELVVIAPMGNIWDNGDHGLAVDPEDEDSLRQAFNLVFSGYSPCDEEDCDVCPD